MSRLSVVERLRETVLFIDTNPSLEKLVRFLSRNLDPSGTIAGVCAYHVTKSGILEYMHEDGFPEDLNKTVQISISDDNPLSAASRTGENQIVDMKLLYENYSDASHRELQAHFETGMGLSINPKTTLGILLKMPYSKAIRHFDYFECMTEIIRRWNGEMSQNECKMERKLSERQLKIVELIREGKTNAGIAQLLDFSESLIRQETIQIYRKLGIRGRSELSSECNDKVIAKVS